MSTTLPNSAADGPRNRFDRVAARMAKADLKKVEDWRELLGKAVLRTLLLAGVTQKEAAALIACEQAHICRWIAGTERPQFDRIFAHPSLRNALVVALAELAEGVTVETHITIRKTA
jgi:hypothetical protein